MTQAQRTLAIKYVHAESRKWLLHRRRYSKKMNIQGCRKKKNRKRMKRKTKNEKQEARHKRKQARKPQVRRLHSNKSTRLCYTTETETLPHHLQSSSCSRRQRYQVSLAANTSALTRTLTSARILIRYSAGYSACNFHVVCISVVRTSTCRQKLQFRPWSQDRLQCTMLLLWLSSHETVLATQRHQHYTQCPS